MTGFAAIGLMAFAALTEPEVDVRTLLTPPEVPFHRQAEFSIIVEAPEGADVSFPDMAKKFAGVPVSDLRRDTQKLKDNRVRITETYVLDPVFAATYAIEPVEVKWGEGQSIKVASPALVVRDLTEDEKKAAEQFAPLAGAATVPGLVERNWKLLAAVCAGVLAAAIALVWAFWLRKRAEKPAPPLPAWEVAYRRLRELDQRQLPQSGKHEPYYVDLSAILRYYIEDRFHVRAPEQTTPEFLAVATNSGAVSSAHQQLLADFLKHSDRVKFAQYVPTVNEMDRSFAMVLRFVDETVPKPDADQPAEESAA